MEGGEREGGSDGGKKKIMGGKERVMEVGRELEVEREAERWLHPPVCLAGESGGARQQSVQSRVAGKGPKQRRSLYVGPSRWTVHH